MFLKLSREFSGERINVKSPEKNSREVSSSISRIRSKILPRVYQISLFNSFVVVLQATLLDSMIEVATLLLVGPSSHKRRR